MASSSQWERSKENILPMKSGRDVNALNAALSEESAGWKEQRLREWRHFQDRLLENENNKEELVNSYYDLLCWLENTFPQGGKKYIKTNAKRCFHKLKDDKSFYNNWKFMKIMIKYIEASGTSCRYVSEDAYCDLYNYMYQNRIGTMHADFFISWANALEASESYPQAAIVYRKGLDMGAEPRKLLEKEKNLFEDRMGLRAIEEMMREDAKIGEADRRQPLQNQGGAVQRPSAVSDDDATIRMKRTSSEVSRSQTQVSGNIRQSFSIHKPDPTSHEASWRPGVVGAAFTAVSSASATNVVPVKHTADKENSQKAEQWTKPTVIPPKPSNSMKQKPTKDKPTSANFQVYYDESVSAADVQMPVLLGQSVLRPKKDDEGEEEDTILNKTGKTQSKSDATTADGNIQFMFNENALMSGPLGEMSFEEIRAEHVLSLKSDVPNVTTNNTPILRRDAESISETTDMNVFLDRDEDHDEKHDNEVDLTMALNAEVSRRELRKTDSTALGPTAMFADSFMLSSSKKPGLKLEDDEVSFQEKPERDAQLLGRAAFADSFALPAMVEKSVAEPNDANQSAVQFNKADARLLGKAACADSFIVRPSKDQTILEAADSWDARPADDIANDTTETVRSSRDCSRDASTTIAGSNGNTNKLSVTQFDCLNRILSEAFRGPSAASVATPFGLTSDETISAEAVSLGNDSSADFLAFNDSVEASAKKPASIQSDSSKAEFFAYEDSFSKESTRAAVLPKRIALQPRSSEKEEIHSKAGLHPVAPPTSEGADFEMFEDSFADRAHKHPAPAPAPKRLALQTRPVEKDVSCVAISDGEADSESTPSVTDSPILKRQRVAQQPQPSAVPQTDAFPVFSEEAGIADCSGIVADYPLCDDVGGGKFSFSATIDFQNRLPKFCSTQYIDMQSTIDSDAQSDDVGFGIPPRPMAAGQGQSGLSNGNNKRPASVRRQSITARVSTMPPLQERSESSSSGGSTMAAGNTMHARDGLSAIWESSMDPPADPNAVAPLPTMNCEAQRSCHHIDVQKFATYSQLQQSVAFADKTYSCLREIDPTDPFSDDLVQRFVGKYEPFLKKLPNYIEVNSKLPTFSSRQSAAGKLIQLAPNYSMNYAFRVGSGSFANVIAARDTEDRRLLACKFQSPACKWEFYICNELRQRLARKTQLKCVLDGIMEIEKIFVYSNGSCCTMQHARYGALLNLVNKSRAQKAELAEPIVAYLTIELLRLVESLHLCHIIHADLKPDNVLFLGLPELPKLPRNSLATPANLSVFPPKEACLRLIDFGRSIDTTLFPPGTAFLAKVATSGFDCIEMKTDRPWTYQADFFGLIGTIHVMIFLEYMNVSWQETTERWRIEKKFKRWWHHNDLWESLFDQLLNIPDCEHQPDIKSIREAFEARFCEKMMANYSSCQPTVMSAMKEQYHAN